MDKRYQVIIVGGRVAGASLAIRLAQQNVNVLLIDRATFPSWPSVPSSPLIHPAAMQLLDELGVAEEEYTNPGSKVRHLILDMMGHFQVIMTTDLLPLDRKYIYGIDRNKFDAVLWRRVSSLSTVTACENVAMTDVIKDSAGRVTGIVGRANGIKVEVHADLVIGADGRFSLAARKFGSEPFEELNDYPGASYHAEWEGVSEYSELYPQPIVNYQIGNGQSVLCIPIDKHRYIIANYLRTGDANFGSKKLEEHYLQLVNAVPHLQAQLKNARRVSPIVGIKRIENGYRQAHGEGWALVGDAFHYESPLDGQGMYNALLASKFLAEAICQWRNGRPWVEAGTEYQQRFYDSSHAMLKQTVKRVQQELYTSPPPPFLIKTLLRWTLTDPEYQQLFLGYLSRVIDPNTVTLGPKLKYIVRGLLRDISKFWKRSI